MVSERKGCACRGECIVWEEKPWFQTPEVRVSFHVALKPWPLLSKNYAL